MCHRHSAAKQPDVPSRPSCRRLDQRRRTHVRRATAGGNRKGYAGYELEPVGSLVLWHVRNRVFNSHFGRWATRDPSGYRSSASLYDYVGSRPVCRIDPTGLVGIDLDPFLPKLAVGCCCLCNAWSPTSIGWSDLLALPGPGGTCVCITWYCRNYSRGCSPAWAADLADCRRTLSQCSTTSMCAFSTPIGTNANCSGACRSSAFTMCPPVTTPPTVIAWHCAVNIIF